MNSDIVVATLTKNTREQLRVSLGEFKGHALVQLRVFFDAGDGDFRPGKQGLSLRTAMLPEIIKALQEADARTGRTGGRRG